MLRVHPGPGADSHVQAPSDGLIVFSCSGCPAAESGNRLFTVRSNGTRFRRLCVARGPCGSSPESDGSQSAYHPRWSPDGRWIAYTKSFNGGEPVRIVSADGSRSRRLTRPLGGALDESPSWSPDGSRLVFVRSAPPAGAGNYVTSLWTVVDVERARSRPLLTAPTNVVSPDWSPDGRSIAFNDILDRLWVANADGSHRRRLGPRTLRGREPRWSPDGARVAFTDPYSSSIRILTRSSGRVRSVSLGNAFAAAWSPDGRRLAVWRARSYPCDFDEPCTDFELWILSLDGRSRKRILSLPYAEIYGLDWGRAA